MTTSTLTLTDFLLARIAEDEEYARRIHADHCGTPAETISDDMGRPIAPACDCDWHVARVLAECEAKRRIVGRHIKDLSPPTSVFDRVPVCAWCDDHWPCEDLADLAAVHADHPDYRKEWRP